MILKNYYSAVTLLFLLLFISCQPKEVPAEKGNIYIQVRDQYGRAVANAVLSAEPTLPEYKTDEFGTVLLKEVNVGSYEIIARKDNYGSGKTAVQVKANDITNATIVLEQGKFVSFAPTVRIEFPTRPANFSLDEPILFKGYVSDNDTGNESLDVKWESNKDGLLNSDKPDKDGVTTFSTNKLSKATHFITLTVKDKSGNTTRDTITVSTLSPKSITLEKPTKIKEGISLTWNKSDASDFKEYRVYRSNETCAENAKVLLAVITEAGKTTYTDTQPPLSKQACYFVEVSTTLGLTRRSLQQQIDYPGGVLFTFVPTDADIHPTKPWIFLANRDKEQVIVYDYEAGKTVSELSVPQASGSILVGDNGDGVNVYIPSRSGHVYVYDATSLALKRSILADASATDVAISGKGHVFISVSNQWTNPLGSYNEKTGMLINQLTWSCLYGGARIKKVPGRNELIAISTAISPTDMDYVAYDTNGALILCKDDSQHGSYPLDGSIFRISPNGTYLLTSANGAAYLPNETMKYLGNISASSGISFSDFAFESDEKIFYGATSSRRSIQIIRYPELLRTDELVTKGYPIRLFKKGQTLISVSRADQSSTGSAIEVVQLK
ncbi:carboxypeptidase-like regulatory domain-containing protein [Spirosoma validum]|uniref:Carboxypeptidase regulatory-like domain-containing protein n=1 Tax=Spirosoma validum TaxID=2771355 RepID=A0A927GEI4_9BACT|nr:carboxypeptidase-like regulatory domain-containing protein [Spirosoma validum]MBD2754867.1 carboxypeptidase regulatory-like domain-containing protein [Spirosoma validum]